MKLKKITHRSEIIRKSHETTMKYCDSRIIWGTNDEIGHKVPVHHCTNLILFYLFTIYYVDFHDETS